MYAFDPMPLRKILFCLALLLTTGGIGLSPALAQKAAPPKPGASPFPYVNISAEQQSFDEQGRTRFTGNVQVAYKDIRIQSNLATLELNAIGEPDIATFYNRPLAKRLTPAKAEDNLQADIIKILINDDKMRGEGDSVSYVTTVAQNPVTIHADVQEFDNTTKTVEALGNVQVDYEATKIYSPKATLWVDENGKAKRVLFSGGAQAKKEQSEINSERITIMVASGNMLAETNVKTNVKTEGKDPDSPDRVLIDSDFQQYDKASETMLASGNVRILYGDYRAFGPKATFKLKDGQVERIFLTGRANIITNGRQVEADKIVITTNPKHFDALGNVKSKFVAKKIEDQKASPAATLPPGSKGTPGGKPSATIKAGAAGGGKVSATPPGAPRDGGKPPEDDYLD